MSLSLLIVDDHELVHFGLRSMLAGSPITFMASAFSKREAIEAIQRDRIDVVLLDVRLPDEDGFAILAAIKSCAPDLAVVMYSAFEYPSFMARAATSGASGFVWKGECRARLLEVLIAAARGVGVWTKEELRKASNTVATMAHRTHDLPLTQRETEILKLLSSGKTNKRIASQLDISYETVKEHVQNILKKIGVSDRTQAAIWAVRQGLV